VFGCSSSDEADNDVRVVVEKYSKIPEAEPRLKSLLPRIISTFGSNKSVKEVIKDLEAHQQSGDALVAEWAKEAVEGLKKGSPFSLLVTQKHFSRVASAQGRPDSELSKLKGVMKAEYGMALRASLRSDFAEGVRAVLVEKDGKPNWSPSWEEELSCGEVGAVFEPLSPQVGDLEV
ncbi:hypothetical protein M569_16750, partial [Genlisea aurea]